jgi:ligand-binding sensor domain-containing protein
MSRIVIFFFLLLGFRGSAQELSHKQYTVKDGLPGSVVYHTLQDRNGFIWFATNQGVSRFDGRSFKNFFKEDGLPDNEILKLYLDRHDNIWFISFSGIPAVWCKGRIYSFPNCAGVLGITEDFITDSIILNSRFTKNSIVYAGHYTTPNKPGLWIFHDYLQREKDIPLQSPVLKKSSEKKINFFFSLVDKRSYVLAVKDTTSTYQYKFPRKKEDVYLILYNSKSYFSISPDKESVLFYTDSLYIGNKRGVRSFISMKDLQLKANDLVFSYLENDSLLWLCSRKKGLIRIKNFLHVTKIIDYYFPKAFCTAIIKDREGGYWITTHNDGVYYVPDPHSYYIPGLAGENAKDVKVIRSLGQPGLLAGSADGSIILLNPANFTSKVFDKWSNRNKNNRILDIRPYGNGKFIIASDYGLYMLSGNDNGKRIGMLEGIKGVIVTDTSILIASACDIRRENPVTGDRRVIFTQRSTCVGGDNSTFYWGSLNGLYKFSGNKISYLGDQYPGLGGVINHIDIAPDSAVWISTQQGLVILQKQQAIVIGKKQGLMSNICKHVLFEDSIAWVSTDRGISRIRYHWNDDIPVYSMTGITENDGLLSDDVNQCVIAGNYVWAATARGVSIFPKTYTGHLPLPPLINITRVVTGDQEMLPGDSIIIDHRKNKLLIELSGISFRSGRQIHYAYRLADLDTNWSNASTSQLEFSILPFGTHIFEVRAIDSWGVKSNDTRRLFFTVTAPFWKTTWFVLLTYLVTAALIGLSVYFFYRNRQQKKDREYRLGKKIYELEIMALKAQMNPHFIFNCLSSIQHYILRADIRNANLYLHKFSTLIRCMLEQSTTSDITLDEELKLLDGYLELEKLRMGERMHYSVVVAETIRQAGIRIPSMIIQPYVENAIRHGISPLEDRQGIICIDFRISGTYLVCTIEDNGIGIPASLLAKQHDMPVHRSLGTSITGSRMSIINAIQKNKMLLRLTDKKEQDSAAQGTIVELSFLLQNN